MKLRLKFSLSFFTTSSISPDILSNHKPRNYAQFHHNEDVVIRLRNFYEVDNVRVFEALQNVNLSKKASEKKMRKILSVSSTQNIERTQKRIKGNTDGFFAMTLDAMIFTATCCSVSLSTPSCTVQLAPLKEERKSHQKKRKSACVSCSHAYSPIQSCSSYLASKWLRVSAITNVSQTTQSRQ